MKILKRFFCKHKHTILSNENWSLFGKDHVTAICVDCGKRWI